jgi:hypothetical protein
MTIISLDKLGVGLVFLPQTSCNPPLVLTSPHCSMVGVVHRFAVVVSSYCSLLRRWGLLIVVPSLCNHSSFICCLCLYSMFLSLLCILCRWEVLVAGAYEKDYSLEVPSKGSCEGSVSWFMWVLLTRCRQDFPQRNVGCWEWISCWVLGTFAFLEGYSKGLWG